jgi:ATP:corrinoid adenosyltransferase
MPDDVNSAHQEKMVKHPFRDAIKPQRGIEF